jgi:tetrahydromethanopterin S-methyltransferase subunit G
MTSANSLSLILRRLDEIERKIDRIVALSEQPSTLAVKSKLESLSPA